MTARRVCANCGKHLGWKDVAPAELVGESLTHGICPDCVAAYRREIARMVVAGEATLTTPRGSA